MKFSDYIALAFKNMWRRKSRTFLTIIAIMVGSLSLILMASVIISIKQSLTEQFQSLGAFDLVTIVKDPNSTDSNSLISSNGDPNSGKMIDNTTLAAMLKIPHVQDATPVLSNVGVSTMRLEGQEKKTYASIIGFDPASDVFHTSIANGRKLTSGDMDKIVVGNRFVEDMGFGSHPQDLLGKNVLLNYQSGGGSAPDWGDLPVKPVFSENPQSNNQNRVGIDIPAEIVGVTASGVLDDGSSYINLAWSRKLMTSISWQQSGNNGPDVQCRPNVPCQAEEPRQPVLTLVKNDNFLNQGYSTIILKADDTANIESIAAAVKALGYGANTAQAMLDQINQILKLVSIVLAIIGGISLFVATIGIINTMVMATFERTREIGVLRACGATRATIRRLFTAEAALLGFWGGVLGMAVSLAVGQVARYIIHHHPEVLSKVPVGNIGNFPWWLIVIVIAFTTVLGMLSGLLPAIKAARLNPVEALRYE